MRRRRRAVVLVVALAGAACGGVGDDRAATTAGTPTATADTTGIDDARPTSTPAERSPETTTDADDAPPTGLPADRTPGTAATGADEDDAPPTGLRLRPDGLGPVDFGVVADETLDELSAVLGPPTADETISARDVECVEGSGWRSCLPMAIGARIVSWELAGIEVALTDARWTTEGEVTTAARFSSWRASAATTLPAPATADGLRPGTTVGELRAAVPDVRFGYGEGVLDGFWIESAAPGGQLDQDELDYWGTLDWNPATSEDTWSDLVRMVQRALDEHGADLVVDGEWGPRSQAAWERFLSEHGLEPVPPTLWLTPEIGDALGLPPDELVVATIVASESTAPSAAAAVEPLTVVVVDPAPNAWVSTGTYRFSGLADPTSRVTAAGRYAVHVAADATWSIDLVLRPGRNVATFESLARDGRLTEVHVPVFYERPLDELMVGRWVGDVTVPAGWTQITGFWVEFRADGSYSAGADGMPAFYYGDDDAAAVRRYRVWGSHPDGQPGSGTIDIVFDGGVQTGTLTDVRLDDDRLGFEFWATWAGTFGPIRYDLVRVATQR